FSSDSAPPLVFDDVQPALLLHSPGPAAGALVLALRDGPRAGPAADARVVAVVQRVVRDAVLEDEVPDVLPRPAQQRVHLHQAELRVPLHDPRDRSVLRLVAADRTDPGVVTHHGPPQREEFPVVTALVRAVDVQGAAVLGLVLLDG